MPDTVARLLGHDPQRDFFQDILSSQLDADRFDYLLRDNLMTGSKYGGFDLRWLVHSLAIDPGSSRLAVAIKGVSAVEAYLQARYHMYRNVYFHKVVRTGEGMVKLALQRGKRLIEQGRLAAPSERDGMLKALAGGQLTLDEFTDLDDIALMNWLKVWSNCDDAVLARLCRGLLNRRLYKTVDLTALDDPARLGRARESAAHAVAAAGGDPEYDIFYDEPSDTPYEIYDGRNPASDIPIQHPDGRLSSFAAISPLTTALSRQLMFRRLHVAPQYRAAVESAVKSDN